MPSACRGVEDNLLPGTRIRAQTQATTLRAGVTVPASLGRGDEQVVGGFVPVVQVDGVGERTAP